MDPNIVVEDEKPLKELEERKDRVKGWWAESKQYREQSLEPRWAKNTKILRGVPLHDKKQVSSITGRPKLYFRKVWSTALRLLASFYQAFLLDKNRFKILGRDQDKDWISAKVLENLTRYHLERMMRRQSGMIKILWGLMECISPGTTVGKLHWKFNEEMGIDEPEFINYPLEQVCLDWTHATTPDKMRYVILENYLTKEELEELGYENLDKVVPVTIPTSQLRASRYNKISDPSNFNLGGNSYDSAGAVGNNYPPPGSQGEGTEAPITKVYLALECFYREKGKITMAALDPISGEWLRKPQVSPYGKMYPIVIGHMLLEPHKLIPEGLPETLEGPQESLNLDINLRKDNQRLAMNGGFIYSRLGRVNLQALRNVKPGMGIAADDPSAVVPFKFPDVTQNSYIEANADQIMIEELSGVNPTKLGDANVSKTGVAQINLAEANAKETLYTAIVAETFFKQLIYLLAYQIQLFESDERIIRVANNKLREDNIVPQAFDNKYDLEFDMDIEIDVGLTEVGRGIRAQRYMAAIDRMLQINTSTIQLLSGGIKVPNPTLFDLTTLAADLLPELGIQNLNKYIIGAQPPAPPEQSTNKGPAQVAAGQNAPQPNEASSVPNEFLDAISSQLGGGLNGA